MKRDRALERQVAFGRERAVVQVELEVDIATAFDEAALHRGTVGDESDKVPAGVMHIDVRRLLGDGTEFGDDA